MTLSHVSPASAGWRRCGRSDQRPKEHAVTDENTVPLFSYGTLRQENVQMASFGRSLAGSLDALPGYASVMIEITDPGVVAASGEKFHPMVVETGNPKDEVPGTLFLITEAELAAADGYEVSDYKRIQVLLKSGKSAWVYVKA
jgi:gamma-glutamylcyclotransferase (GGCT)/AIG2-like uncharacterized protein YtfP